MPQIEWDDAKNAANLVKHGLSSDEASDLFTSDTDYLEIFDEALSTDEDRFICIGPIKRGVVLVVITEPSEGAIRIISARAATKREREMFLWSQGGLT